MQPFKFLPYFKNTIWGGTEISRFKGLSSNCTDIGESWEISAIPGYESIVAEGEYAGMTLTELVATLKGRLVGEQVYRRFGNNFPLLVKFIDANDDLSLQVHPDDELAYERHRSLGKTEMWYILATRDNAKIHTGFSRPVTKEEYLRRVSDGTLLEVIRSFDSRPGDLFFLPAGRIHAIGAGNLLVEIQESSDITYRVDDYNRRDSQGRLRELHTELAVDAINFSHPADEASLPDSVRNAPSATLVECRHFNVTKEKISGEREIENRSDSFAALICISGEGKIIVDGISTRIQCGETVLMPASAGNFTLSGNFTLLAATMPPAHHSSPLEAERKADIVAEPAY